MGSQCLEILKRNSEGQKSQKRQIFKIKGKPINTKKMSSTIKKYSPYESVQWKTTRHEHKRILLNFYFVLQKIPRNIIRRKSETQKLSWSLWRAAKSTRNSYHFEDCKLRYSSIDTFLRSPCRKICQRRDDRKERHPSLAKFYTSVKLRKVKSVLTYPMHGEISASVKELIDIKSESINTDYIRK